MIDISPLLFSSVIGIQVVGFAVEEIVSSIGNIGYVALEMQP